MHKLVRFNFTTYDVRRAQDVINPATSHCNIMMLATASDGQANLKHPFCYARVIGIYHVNVIYTGPGMLDYTPRRLDFLWVRWYRVDDEVNGWDTCSLDRLSFPPMANDDAFSFVDPANILRCCHIIPAFAKGKRQLDGVGLSRCARDSQDFHGYFANRYMVS